MHTLNTKTQIVSNLQGSPKITTRNQKTTKPKTTKITRITKKNTKKYNKITNNIKIQ